MKKFAKIMAIVLAMALTAAVSVSLTLAYLTDTDEQVNVMTLGNVSIKQHEYERATNADGTYKTATFDGVNSYVLKDFTQAKPLYPAVGDPGINGWDPTVARMSQVNSYGAVQFFNIKNAQDKIVTVENTGKSDAYVRTIVAMEIGTMDINLLSLSSRYTDTADDYSMPWIRNNIGIIQIDGTNYSLVEYVYHGAKLSNDTLRHANGVLPAGETSYPNLCQFYLKSAATNEDCEKLDGNKNGCFDVLVLTQAVQTEGFADAATALDTAFGAITTTNHPWADKAANIPVTVATAEELADAMTTGGIVLLTDDITLKDESIIVATGVNTTLNLNGHTLSAENTRTATSNYMIDVKGGELTVNNGTITMKHTGTNMGWNGATTIFDVTAGGVLNLQNTKVINQGGTDMNFAVHLNNWGAATLNANNCVFEGTYCAVRVFNSGYDMNNVTITNSNLKGSSSAFWVHNYTAADFGASYDATAIDARLNLNIYDNGNAFECDKAPVRFGFTNSVRFNADGTQAE